MECLKYWILRGYIYEMRARKGVDCGVDLWFCCYVYKLSLWEHELCWTLKVCFKDIVEAITVNG